MTGNLSLYDRLIYGLAYLAGVSLAIVTVLIIYDVFSRNFGLPAMSFVSAAVEYTLLFSTMAAAPWLVRINGHVSISSFTNMLPSSVEKLVNKGALLIGIAATAVLSFVAARLTDENWVAGTVEIRSISVPGWILYAFMAVGFGLMATELLRLLLRGEVYTGADGDH